MTGEYEIQRGSQGAEVHAIEDEFGESPLVIIPHDAPNVELLENFILRFFNDEYEILLRYLVPLTRS